MPTTLLLTGSPGSGKTTVIENTIATLEADGLTAGGVYCPEIRTDGERVGFGIVDIMTGESAILANVDRESGPSVGRYRVNVANVDAISEPAFSRNRRSCSGLQPTRRFGSPRWSGS